VVTEIAGRGTPESLWLPWLRRAEWLALDLPSANGPVVVAPHPDDEILGAAGLLALQHVQRNRGTEIVAVTDGEASHPSLGPAARVALADRRRAETDAALRALRVDVPIHRLRQPDGDVDEEALSRFLVPRLTRGRWCVTTWRGDGHPDHEAVGRACAAACAATGARLVEYPIWMWHWATPDDERVPWTRARHLPLARDVQLAKAAAIAEFRSQTEQLMPGPDGAPILPSHVIARFLRPHEVFFL
jgi:LmbE family N-acetylglucosaminyl deacetylase